jgi:uncharacterized RDD family membrane protein YckC
MKRRSARALDEPTLFDLPLNHPEQGESSSDETESPEPAVKGREIPPNPPPVQPSEFSSPAVSESVEIVALPIQRWISGLADIGVLGVALLVVWGGARGLGVAMDGGDLPALLVFLLLFSLFYTVISLAFWGQTPGMSLQALRARSLDDEPVSFSQALRRWLGAVGVALSCGLLLWLQKSGRSLSDWTSGTRTEGSGEVRRAWP